MSFRVPRLLPITIAILALVLMAKSTLLVQGAILAARSTPFIATARASGSEASEKTAAKPLTKSEHAADAKAEPPAGAEKSATVEAPSPVTDGERAILLELRDRRRELEAREAALAARESMLAAAEAKLSERVRELQGLQRKLEALDAGRRQQDDAAWQGLVKVYETMKPRDAAAIFNDLGMPVLLAVVGRMKEAKAAAILAAMTPEKAREVTMRLATTRSGPAATAEQGDKPALAPEPGKAPGQGT